jgi:hypothetical protein
MKRKREVSFLIGTVLLSSVFLSAQNQTAGEWDAVASAMGKAGLIQPGDVYKISLPRFDLHVKAGGVKIAPALALGAWVAFKKMGTDCMVMGDLVLTEDEVNPVMTKLEQGGIEITAIHNHLLGESPHIMYMHIGGMGQPQKMAEAIHSALVLSKMPFGNPTGKPAASDLDAKQLDSILGRPGKANGNVLQYSFPRAEKISENGMEIPPSMGMATSINFQSTGAGKAAIAGDFVMKSREVNEVLKVLRSNGIEVTALHSHMLNEEPRLFFMHFWANDDAVKLARGLRTALDKTNLSR